MTSRRVPLLPLLFLSAACAHAGGRATSPAGMHQADERIPAAGAFPSGKARSAYQAALAQEQRGWQLESSGDTAGARQPLEAAARAYLAFVDHSSGPWDVTLRYHAADLLRRAQAWDDAASVAGRVANDPRADAKSKAMAWLEAANAQVGAKKLDPIQIAPASERSGSAPAPRQMPEAWKRFSDAADQFLQSPAAAEPEARDRTLTNAQLALIAGRVAFAYDDMDLARRDLGLVLDRWPADARTFQSAAPLYVQSFLVAGDQAGAQAALDRVRSVAQAQLASSQDPAGRGAYQKVVNETEHAGTSLRYEQAKALLDAGKAAEAAQAFEALANDPNGDQAAALVSGAIAWDKAGQPDRAAELRRRAVEQHADSKLAPAAELQLAAYLSKKGDHTAAAEAYQTHAQKWPDDPSHCTALRNGAVELDLAKDAGAAADAYRSFGADGRCAQGSPDVAALALYRAGQLYKTAHRRADARDAFQAAADVKGVSTPDGKKHVADARRQAKQLGSAAGRRGRR